MQEQHPHLEILSRNRVNRSQFFIAPVTVIGLAFSGLFIWALIPFLWLIAYGLLTLASIGFLYLVALMAIHVYHKWIEAHVVHLGEYGAVDPINWRMVPLALPAPVITEISEDEVLKRSKILNLRAKGRSLREIEAELNIPYNQVQKICAAATNLVIEK